VLAAEHRKIVVAQRPELGDVGAKQHVAITEERPPFEAAEIGNEEAGEGELGRLQLIALAREESGKRA